MSGTTCVRQSASNTHGSLIADEKLCESTPTMQTNYLEIPLQMIRVSNHRGINGPVGPHNNIICVCVYITKCVRHIFKLSNAKFVQRILWVLGVYRSVCIARVLHRTQQLLSKLNIKIHKSKSVEQHDLSRRLITVNLILHIKCPLPPLGNTTSHVYNTIFKINYETTTNLTERIKYVAVRKIIPKLFVTDSNDNSRIHYNSLTS